jgi:uncharacterized protein DUF4919
MKYTILAFTFLLSVPLSFGQSSTEVKVPSFGDKYSQFVKQLESGQTSINYKEFRESFIESEQFKEAAKKSKEYDDLKEELYSLVKNNSYQKIIPLAKQMLSLDYTSMIAHTMLSQAYKNLGNNSNAEKYKTIQLGLINSIIKNGDGKTCETSWPVIKIEEEYFILQVLGASLLKQSTNGTCDKMYVKTQEDERNTIYFEISKVFEGYKKRGIN